MTEIERIASKSRLTEKDVRELSEKIDRGILKQWEKAKRKHLQQI